MGQRVVNLKETIDLVLLNSLNTVRYNPVSGVAYEYPVKNTVISGINPTTGVATYVPVTGSGVEVVVNSAIIPYEYDYIDCTYTGNNMTGVVFKTGGSGGTTVATLAITYDGNDNIDTVTRT